MFYQIINILSTAASKESPMRLKGPNRTLPATDLFTKWIPFHRSLLSLLNRVDVIALFFCAREHSSSSMQAFECSFEFAAALKIICSRIEGGQRRLSSFFSHFRSLEAVFCATNYAWNTERPTEKFFLLSSPFFCALLSSVEFSSLFHILTVLISPVVDGDDRRKQKSHFTIYCSVKWEKLTIVSSATRKQIIDVILRDSETVDFFLCCWLSVVCAHEIN